MRQVRQMLSSPLVNPLTLPTFSDAINANRGTFSCTNEAAPSPGLSRKKRQLRRRRRLLERVEREQLLARSIDEQGRA